MNAIEFVKKYKIDNVEKYICRMHIKATHIYIGYGGVPMYFYKHENRGWCEVDHRTTGWDSDRCCYEVHPPVSAMVEIKELKQIVDAFELAEAYKHTPKQCLMPKVIDAFKLVEQCNG